MFRSLLRCAATRTPVPLPQQLVSESTARVAAQQRAALNAARRPAPVARPKMEELVSAAASSSAGPNLVRRDVRVEQKGLMGDGERQMEGGAARRVEQSSEMQMRNRKRMVSTRKIYVAKLHWTTGRYELMKHFSKFGEIGHCTVSYNFETGFSNFYGFVEFKDERGASRALEQQQHVIDGRELLVQRAGFKSQLPYKFAAREQELQSFADDDFEE